MSWRLRFSGGDPSSGPQSAEGAGTRASLLATIDALLEGDEDRAEQGLCAYARDTGRPARADILLAKLYRHRGEHARAVRTGRATLIRPDLSPTEEVDALAALGHALTDAGERAQAMAAFEEALHGNARHAGALAGRLRLFADAGRYAEALSDLRRLERADGRERADERVRLLLGRAMSERAAGHEGRARRLEQKAKKLATDEGVAEEQGT